MKNFFKFVFISIVVLIVVSFLVNMEVDVKDKVLVI